MPEGRSFTASKTLFSPAEIELACTGIALSNSTLPPMTTSIASLHRREDFRSSVAGLRVRAIPAEQYSSDRMREADGKYDHRDRARPRAACAPRRRREE